MAQLSYHKINQLWPVKSDKIWFLSHFKNAEKTAERCINSVKQLTDNIVILVDDSSTDNTLEVVKQLTGKVHTFRWQHNFSYAKNLCLQIAMREHGIKFGDWVLFMGDDFELQPHVIPEIKSFVADDGNFFAQFEVPEYHLPGQKFVTRKRKLLWRHHPLIYWEGLVHEEAVYSAYRLTGLGLQFGEGLKYKEFPVLGGDNGMVHYGFHEDGGEEGEYFWWKKCYYVILAQIGKLLKKWNLPETEAGMLEALSHICDAKQVDVHVAVTGLMHRYMNGESAQVSQYFSPHALMEYNV